MKFVDTQAADAAIHALAIRLARQCRHIIQVCLREEEWPDADHEFYRVIRQGLEDHRAQDRSLMPTITDRTSNGGFSGCVKNYMPDSLPQAE